MSSSTPSNTDVESGTEKPATSDAKEQNDTSNDEDVEYTYPEGGAQAWGVVIGASMILFSTFGYANAFGVFQEYYQTHQLASSTPSQIAWIGSIQVFLLFASMLVGGPLFDQYGATFLPPAAILYILSVFMTSLSTKYAHFIITQGLVGGVAMGLTMAPLMGAIGHYFNKKRGATIGIALAGSSLGGVIFPVALGKMLNNPKLSFAWTIRICGFMVLALIVPSLFFIRPRLPRRKGQFIIPSAFKNRLFVAIIVACFFMMFGLFTPFFYLPSYAVSRGMSHTLAPNLVAILNAASFFGRVIPGILGDKWGRLNLLLVAGLSTAVLIFCFTLVKTNAEIIVYSILYGFCQGAIVSGMSVSISAVPKDQKQIGTYMGMGMSLISIATLIGPPINGVFVTVYHDFKEVSYFSGAVTLVGALTVILAKMAAGKGFFVLN